MRPTVPPEMAGGIASKAITESLVTVLLLRRKVPRLRGHRIDAKLSDSTVAGVAPHESRPIGFLDEARSKWHGCCSAGWLESRNTPLKNRTNPLVRIDALNL